MKKFVPLEKQQKKKQKEHYKSRRGNWNVKPVTLVVSDKKKDKKRDEITKSQDY